MTIALPPSTDHPLLMAFDPGKTVGWSMTDLPDRSWFGSGQTDITGVADIVNTVLQCLTQKARTASVMIIEQFNVAARPVGSSRTVVITAESIGVLRYLAERYGASVELKLPVTRTIVTPQHLKGLGWYRPGNDHANQATRHLVAWLLTHGYHTIRL